MVWIVLLCTIPTRDRGAVIVRRSYLKIKIIINFSTCSSSTAAGRQSSSSLIIQEQKQGLNATSIVLLFRLESMGTYCVHGRRRLLFRRQWNKTATGIQNAHRLPVQPVTIDSIFLLFWLIGRNRQYQRIGPFSRPTSPVLSTPIDRTNLYPSTTITRDTPRRKTDPTSVDPTPILLSVPPAASCMINNHASSLQSSPSSSDHTRPCGNCVC